MQQPKLKQCTIKYKRHMCASPREGMKQVWDEYQVKYGAVILSRHDTLQQAEAMRHKFQAELDAADKQLMRHQQ